MMPKLIVFDLDGTLAESKQPLSPEMGIMIGRLLEITNVAITSGGSLQQFQKQVIPYIPSIAHFEKLYLLPTSGAALHEYSNGEWKKVYEELLTTKEVHEIESAIREAAKETGIINFSHKAWGERIENRGSQVSISALGQQAPLSEKKAWDPDRSKRRALQAAIVKLLPKYSAGIGGITTIDVTRHGIDKAYGLRKLCERIGVAESDTLYIGDELESGGNDEAVYKTNAQTRSVKDPADTKHYIERLVADASA